MARADEETLRQLAATVVAQTGYDLEELVVVAAGRRRLLRVIVDGDEGVSLDAAAMVSRRLSAALEELPDSFMGPEPYTLEVSSPGIGRPLTEERHFRRARGRLVNVTLIDGGTVSGRVRRVLDGNVELLLVGKNTRSVPVDKISRAKVEVEFGTLPVEHAAVLAADGFVDHARVVDIDDDAAAGDASVDDKTDDDDPGDDEPGDEPAEEEEESR